MPSDAGWTGSANDTLERWAAVDGDAADDNGVVDLVWLDGPLGEKIVGEGADASIRYVIIDDGVRDESPLGLVSSYGDEGEIGIEFTDGERPRIVAGGSATFALKLKTDAFALIEDRTLEVRLLGGPDFLWSDAPQTYFEPVTGSEVAGFPISSPRLTVR